MRLAAPGDLDVPHFDGATSVRLAPLKDTEHRFSLEVEFRALAADGTIFYAQQTPDGAGDFISLALVDGYVGSSSTLYYIFGSLPGFNDSGRVKVEMLSVLLNAILKHSSQTKLA